MKPFQNCLTGWKAAASKNLQYISHLIPSGSNVCILIQGFGKMFVMLATVLACI